MKTLAIFISLLLCGCATREEMRAYVQGQLKPVETRVSALEGRADVFQTTIDSGTTGLAATGKRLDDAAATLKSHGERLNKTEADLALVSKTSQEALERAVAAGKLAEGKMAYEVVLSDDQVKFGSGKSALSPSAMAVLDQFAAKVKGENRSVYIEIQGHSDNIGDTAFNLLIGQRRAEAVLRYLHAKAGIPLQRMSAISYGETAPVANNHHRVGRAQNRRVVLVVLY